jgi:hypothetical protein
MSEHDDIHEWYDKRNQQLADAGYSESVSLGGGFGGGMFAPDATTCQSCGALVLLPQYVEDPDKHPVMIHTRWHEKGPSA